MTEFSTLGLAEPLLRAITAEGYTEATPVQAKAIPPILEGRDAIAIAQTGTGKTAAFVLPILQRLATDRKTNRPKTCRTLVLAPTRELAAQTAECARTLGRAINPRVAVVVGGVKMGPQVHAMARGVDILVATPGRLLDHMGSGNIKLDHCEMLVLDEADQMLDLGFLPPIKRVLAALPHDRQTVMVSATMPKAIAVLAQEVLSEPVQVSVTPTAKPADKVDQRIIHSRQPDKRAVLVTTLKGMEIDRAIIFTRTKHGADRLVRQLGEDGLASVAIHGNKSQAQRTRALEEFRRGRTRILVATDIAARGIDVDGVSHVVNYELPDVPEAYVHRIGRTARAGASGVAISLVDGSELGLLRDIERLIGRSLPREGDVPAEMDRPARKGGGKPGNRGGRPGGNRPQGAQGGQHKGKSRFGGKPGQGQQRQNAEQRDASGAGRPAGEPRRDKKQHGGAHHQQQDAAQGMAPIKRKPEAKKAEVGNENRQGGNSNRRGPWSDRAA